MKKGFTLTELLGVIVIIGIIALIITPVVANMINRTKEATYNKQVNTIELAAKQWGVENVDYLPEVGSDFEKAITLDTLISSGKIENSTILDPRTNGEMSGCVLVSYNSEYNQHEYKYSEDDSLCKICVYDTTSDEPQGTIGSRYICNLGEFENAKGLKFYLLEIGNSPVENSNLEENEFALIMDKNYDNETQFHSGINTKLETIRNNWSKLDRTQINLPTFEQISNFGEYDEEEYMSDNLPSWLYMNLNTEEESRLTGIPTGYWSYHSQNGFVDVSVYKVDNNYKGYIATISEPLTDYNAGIRPVIILDESNL